MEHKEGKNDYHLFAIVLFRTIRSIRCDDIGRRLNGKGYQDSSIDQEQWICMCVVCVCVYCAAFVYVCVHEEARAWSPNAGSAEGRGKRGVGRRGKAPWSETVRALVMLECNPLNEQGEEWTITVQIIISKGIMTTTETTINIGAHQLT